MLSGVCCVDKIVFWIEVGESERVYNCEEPFFLHVTRSHIQVWTGHEFWNVGRALTVGIGDALHTSSQKWWYIMQTRTEEALGLSTHKGKHKETNNYFYRMDLPTCPMGDKWPRTLRLWETLKVCISCDRL
jgi:hypothetical protein